MENDIFDISNLDVSSFNEEKATDNTFFKLSTDEKGNGSAIVRFLPDPNNITAQLMYLNVIKYCPDDKTYTVPIPRYYKQKVFTLAERDIMLMDYLSSPDYQRELKILDDPKTMQDILDVYNSYEKRSLDAYRARCAEKAKKKRLL